MRQRYQGFTRQEFLALPVMADYDRYYKRFNKTYHVQLQLESIVLKGKPLPDVSPAVDANFMAEVETLILTAGHDGENLGGPIVIDVSRDGEQMTQMNGSVQAARADDMIMRAAGEPGSIIYGQAAVADLPGDLAGALRRLRAGRHRRGRRRAPAPRNRRASASVLRDLAVEQRRVLTA